jgi:hypothetical protein
MYSFFFYLTLQYKLNRQHNSEWKSDYKARIAEDVETTTHFQVVLRRPRINVIRECKWMNNEEERKRERETKT